MSAKAINWAWRQTGLTPVEKCVLMALADFHTDSAGCFPSVKSICEKANIKKTAALNALVTLEKMGFIQKETRKGKLNNHISNNYSLSINEKHTTPSPLNAPPPSALNTPPLVRKTDYTPSPLNAPPSPLNGPKLIEDNNTDTSYLADEPPKDENKIFWDAAIQKLSDLAVPPKKARPMIGKWLKSAKDDKTVVMAAIDKAVEIGTRDPVPYITKALDNSYLPTYKQQTQKGNQDAIEWLKARIADQRSGRPQNGAENAGGGGSDDLGMLPSGDNEKPADIRPDGGSSIVQIQAGNTRETGGPRDRDSVESEISAFNSGIDF